MKNHTDIIKGLREDKDLKQIDVAKILDTSQQHYSRYETGAYDIPVRALMILADFYGVSTDYLLGRTEYKNDLAALNNLIAPNITIGMFISETQSLSNRGIIAVVEYISLQKLKEQSNKYSSKKV